MKYIYYIYVNHKKYTGEIKTLKDADVKKELLEILLNKDIDCANCEKDGGVRYESRVGVYKCRECKRSLIQIVSDSVGA